MAMSDLAPALKNVGSSTPLEDITLCNTLASSKSCAASPEWILCIHIAGHED